MNDWDTLDDDAWNGPGDGYGDRYEEAYGDYRGGYGPRGGYGGPPRSFGGPPGNFGPGPMFQGPPPLMGSGYGPLGPPKQRGPLPERVMKYLVKCGMARDVVKRLPHQILMLIEPQYCGVCVMELESFQQSCLHYGSKNHLKNQKKWLTQYNLNFGMTPREVPLKSRELYCELCDVQITSKVHAESHYNGRPHRQIVEGYKMPKNPMIMQRGNEARLEQLLRREKRCLKPIDEVEAEQQVKQKPIKDEKLVSPELYCSICETSVTCTEQMTMHMNGKKHLAKEKQYILKFMKGGNKNVKEEKVDFSQDADVTMETGEGAAAEECGQAGDGDDADWNGTGEKWETEN